MTVPNRDLQILDKILLHIMSITTMRRLFIPIPHIAMPLPFVYSKLAN